MKKELRKMRQVNFRVTEREYRLLCAKAKFLDIGLSDYIRESVIDRRLKGFKFTEQEIDPNQMTIDDFFDE